MSDEPNIAPTAGASAGTSSANGVGASRQEYANVAAFWSYVVERDYKAARRKPDDFRSAIHCAISLYHMADWVYKTHTRGVRLAFGIKSKKGNAFANKLKKEDRHFGLVRDIANAAKHRNLSLIANTVVVSGNWPDGHVVLGSRRRIVLEEAGGTSIEFTTIAKSVRAMWIRLNAQHGWWP